MEADVIVVGAGPAGLMLAGELRLAGVRVTVLEKLPAPTGESRGLGFTARTLEVLDQRGLLSRFGAVTTSNQGHFGGLPIDFGLVKGAHFGAKNVPQAQTEKMLGEWVLDVGADVLRGYEFVGLTQDADGVTADVLGPDGPTQVRAKYLVGCDGGRSAVRKAAGFEFPGTAATMEMFLADITGVQLKPRMIGETLPGGMVMAGHLTDGVQRIIVCERGTPPKKRTEPIEWPEIAAAWQRLTGEDIGHAEATWMSSFGDASRQASEYRRGRVLLAGDAAHIHLPAGGQGMNASIQDTVNLGWKLAAAVHGWAPSGLLDSYHLERHAVGRRLLMNTQAQGLLFLSGSEMQPLRDLFSELMASYLDVTKHLIGMVSGLEITYNVGPGDHPLLGRRLPDHEVTLADGQTVRAYDLLAQGRGILLDYADDPQLRALAAAWADRIDILVAKPANLTPEDEELADSQILLVRPDGYVAWAYPYADEMIDLCLLRWFGKPNYRLAVG